MTLVEVEKIKAKSRQLRGLNNQVVVPANLPELGKEGEARDLVANKVGFKSGVKIDPMANSPQGGGKTVLTLDSGKARDLVANKVGFKSGVKIDPVAIITYCNQKNWKSNKFHDGKSIQNGGGELATTIE